MYVEYCVFGHMLYNNGNDNGNKGNSGVKHNSVNMNINVNMNTYKEITSNMIMYENDTRYVCQ